MRLLIKAAWGNKVYRRLVCIMIPAMIFLTIASSLEILTLGVITRQGPDFFKLFGPVQDGKVMPVDQITLQEVEDKWTLMTKPPHEVLTQKDTTAYLASLKKRNLIDEVFVRLDQNFDLLGHPIHLAFLLVAVALFKAITLFAHRYATRLAAISVSADLRQKYFEHIQKMPMEFYQGHNLGGLSSRVVSDAASIAEAINACMVNYLQTPFTVFWSLTLCIATSWKLSIIIFLGFPLIAFPIIFLAKRVRRVSKQLLGHQERFASVLIDYLSGIQTVKVFGMEDFSMKKYSEQNSRMMALERKSARYDLSSRPIVHSIAMLFLAATLLYGLYGLQMTVPEVLIYCGFLYTFYEPIKKFAEENSHIQRGVAAAERMFEVLRQKPNLCDSENARPLSSFTSEIAFNHVWFKYQDMWVLKDVSFTIAKGEMVAIVGPTGSGKSTIVQLLARLYDATKGEITIDGVPIKDYQIRTLREAIGFVPQKPFLFLDTIRANIAFGRPYSDLEVEEAAKKGHAHDFIIHKPEGYDTVLKDAGGNLSGGQQQRLAISRALIKNAPILVLDEATSALDAISEQHIKQVLRELHGQITQIVIAHRMSTIEDADKIIYVENGSIVDIGTKDELLYRCTAFKYMWEAANQKNLELELEEVNA